MRKYLILVALLGLFLLPVPTAAASAGPHNLQASFTSLATPPGPPIGSPPGFEEGWSAGSSGGGQMVSGVYSGDILVAQTHYSRWLTSGPRTNGVVVGEVGGGRLTVTAASDPASTLVLAFAGVFQVTGDPSGPFTFDAHITLRYTIIEGTGVFAGATGHGHIVVTGNALESGQFTGSLQTG